jgi:hypothetical protein
MNWQNALSLIGALIAIGAGMLYVRTILSGETKPHRVTWGGWTLVGVLGLTSSAEGGAGPGLLVTGAFVLVIAIVFALSLVHKYGKPGGSPLEYMAGAAAALALLSQLFINYSPAVGATIAVAADIVFLWPTLKAAWLQPDTEALHPWVIGSIAELLGVMALGNYSYAASAYSFYILAGNLAVVAALAIRQPRHKPAKKRAG